MKTSMRCVREKYHKLTELLIEHGLTITTMESATSGQIASLITDTEGSSAILKGAFITYSNEAKILMGVPEEIISRYSVYSVETAKAMAERCAEIYHANIGIGVTGTMGNIDPANATDSVPGHVYYAVCLNGTTVCRQKTLAPEASRLLYKLAVADHIAQLVFELLGNT